MARFDKVEPKGGAFRAKLGFDIPAADVGKVFGVSVDANGKVQKGGAAIGDIRGVVCASSPMVTNDAVDVMTDGEIVDMTGFTGGQGAYSATTGVLSSTNTGQPIGFTVEAWRLIVRVAR